MKKFMMMFLAFTLFTGAVATAFGEDTKDTTKKEKKKKSKKTTAAK